MKYLKTYEGIFDKPKEEIDKYLLIDLLTSDLDGLEFKSISTDSKINVLDSIEFLDSEFKSYNNKPVLSKKVWFDNKIEVASRILTGNRHVETCTNSGGIVLFKKTDPELSIKEGFLFTLFVLDNINYERMKQYNIGYCLFSRFYNDSILFYPL